MSGEDESGEKSHEPSPRKLEQARKKGDIPRAPDLLTAMAYLGLFLCGLSLGGYSLREFATNLVPLVEQPDRLDMLFFRDGAQSMAGQVISAGLLPVLPLFLFPLVLVCLTLLATRGIVFTGSKLTPKASRLSPIENAKNKYGRRGLFEFAKSFVKLTIYSLLLTLFLRGQMESIIGAVRTSPAEVAMMIADLLMRFLFIVVIIASLIGGIDAVWQRLEHHRKNRMSLKELRDEAKEAEGDPHLKQHRRSRAQEIAMNQMMSDVPSADVVVVNPTHFAVALKWSRLPGSAPICVAKGTDAVALKIREVAGEAQVPIHSDPPTARALFATVNIGAEISPDHYQPVAAAIRFADKMRAKARQRGYS